LLGEKRIRVFSRSFTQVNDHLVVYFGKVFIGLIFETLMINVREDIKHCGVPLGQQRKNYGRALRPWDPESPGQYMNTVGTNPDYHLDTVQHQMESTRTAQNASDLVKVFRVHNINDFKVLEDWNDPNRPTESEFRDLLADYAKWMRRPIRHLRGKRKEVTTAQLGLIRTAEARYRDIHSN